MAAFCTIRVKIRTIFRDTDSSISNPGRREIIKIPVKTTRENTAAQMILGTDLDRAPWVPLELDTLIASISV